MKFENLPPTAENHVFFDIETIPAQYDGAYKFLYDAQKPPAPVKDKEAWLGSDKHADAAEKALAKTSFDGLMGEVVSIRWAYFDMPSGELRVDGHTRGHDIEKNDEQFLLMSFFTALSNYRPRAPRIVGHNILGFDIKFLSKRALVLGVPMPSLPIWPRDVKPWETSVLDTMTTIDNDRSSYPSLDKVCHALGIPGKDGVDGSMVADLWAMGEFETIHDYCGDDTRKLAQIWLAMVRCGMVT